VKLRLWYEHRAREKKPKIMAFQAMRQKPPFFNYI